MERSGDVMQAPVTVAVGAWDCTLTRAERKHGEKETMDMQEC